MAKRASTLPARYRTGQDDSGSDDDSEAYLGRTAGGERPGAEKKRRRKANEIPLVSRRPARRSFPRRAQRSSAGRPRRGARRCGARVLTAAPFSPQFVDQKRQTFSKRKKGMVSKAAQLSHLTGAKVGSRPGPGPAAAAARPFRPLCWRRARPFAAEGRLLPPARLTGRR
jgi:hypothetical protein